MPYKLKLFFSALTLLISCSTFADDFDDSLAAINIASIGYWEGILTAISDTGDVTEIPNSFTFIVTDVKGLNFSFWRANSINWEIYEGQGVYTAEVYGSNGSHRTHKFLYSDLHAPDKNGDWSYVLTDLATIGQERESRTRFWMDDGKMNFVAESRLANSDENFSPALTGSFSKQ